jgi:phosphoglucomutase
MKRSYLPPEKLIDPANLKKAYYEEIPDPSVASERVSFGTSGHRGSSLTRSFNEKHILAITQAICEWRKGKGITGPLFLGMDTHALSEPAMKSALEVLGAHGVDVVVSEGDPYTPSPVISLMILQHPSADGIVITPSHNPPGDGGFKYDPPNGGPADVSITDWIQKRANALLDQEIKKVAHTKVRRMNFQKAYIEQLGSVVDMESLRDVHMGVDPLGGAGVHYWKAIRERYKLNLTVVSEEVDPTFRFMTVDWDGQIRMDPSSPYAMGRLIELKDRFEIAFACDTDHDRHGIVTKSGLMPANHYLATAVSYLFQHRPNWKKNAAVGKTIVSTQMIDKVAAKLNRDLYETPVGFKWFVDGLLHGTLGFGGEESAGASFLRKDGTVWTTDKDGIILGLLAGEIKAKTGKDPSEIYQKLTEEFGVCYADRVETKATLEQKKRLKEISIAPKELAGEKVKQVLKRAPSNQAPIGGVKVVTEQGWFAARPSGTEDIYKIYAESFKSEAHLKKIIEEAVQIVNRATGTD